MHRAAAARRTCGSCQWGSQQPQQFQLGALGGGGGGEEGVNGCKLLRQSSAPHPKPGAMVPSTDCCPGAGGGQGGSYRCLTPKRPRAEQADLGRRPLPTVSRSLGSEAGPTGRCPERPRGPSVRSAPARPSPRSPPPLARSPGAPPPPPASPRVRERPHFSSRRSGQHSASCTGSTHWAASTDAPPRASNWPIARGFTGRRAPGTVTVLRRFRGSLGLSGLLPPAPSPSPKETSGTRA